MHKALSFICFLLLSLHSFSQSIAPNFSVTDLNGTQHQLYQYLEEGKVVVLDFWAVWSNPARQDMPALESFWQSYGPNGSDEVILLGMESWSTTDADANNAVANLGISFPVVNQTGNTTALYGISFFPSYIVICPNLSYQRITGTPSTIAQNLAAAVSTCAPIVDEPNDVALYPQALPKANCSDELHIPLELANLGDNSLQTLDIVVNLDGNAFWSDQWTGNLPPFSHESDTLIIPLTNVAFALHDVEVIAVNPNGLVDDYVPNNSFEFRFLQQDADSATEFLFQLRPDNFPEETYWELAEGSAYVVACGGGYTREDSLVELLLCVPKAQCYTLTLYDEFGDGFFEGGGSVIIQENGIELLNINQNDHTTAIDEFLFCADGGVVSIEDEFSQPKLKLYPNPASDLLHIEWKENDLVTVSIYDMQARLVIRQQLDSNRTINVANLEKGMYLLEIEGKRAIFMKQ